MKQYLLFCIAAIIISNSHAQRINYEGFLPPAPFNSPDEQITQQSNDGSRSVVFKEIANRHDNYNISSSAWEYVDSAIYSYNTDAKFLGSNFFRFNSSFWNSYSKVTYVYDGNGDNTQFIYQYWINHLSAWRNGSQFVSTFNASHQKTEEVYQTWDTTGNVWVNNSKYISTWDINNNRSTYIVQTWSGGAWLNVNKFLYTYDINNKLTERLYQKWNTGASNWDNYEKFINTYDINDDRILIFYWSWNSGSLSWEDSYKSSYTYANHNQVTLIDQTWNTSLLAWVNEYRSQNTYDASWNLTLWEDWVWNSGNSSWRPYYRHTYSYDGNNNNTYEFVERYNTTNLIFENLERYYYYYQSFNVSGIAETNNTLGASVFPNPAVSENIEGSFTAEGNAGAMINIYDISGRLLTVETMACEKGDNHFNISVSGLLAGNYFIQIADRSNNKTSVLRFVKE